jgi:hypothetical protein
MLYGVREVNVAFVNSRFVYRATQKQARWTDKGPALDILLISRLLADKNDVCVFGSFANNGFLSAGNERLCRSHHAIKLGEAFWLFI